MSTPPGQATIERFIDPTHEAIFARADFSSLFHAYLDHTRLWSLPADPLSEVMMRQALGGAALYLSCRPRDEILAWTLNIKKPPLNLFFTGDGERCTVTGRAYTEDVRTAEASRLFVQSRRRKGRGFTSVIDVEGWDVLAILEAFSMRSEQASVRYFELAETDYLMVASLPREQEEPWLDDLDRDTALAALDGLRPLDERIFWFQCGCDPEKMLHTVRRMFEGRKDELFLGEESVTVSCPRCGRHWNVSRDQLG